MTSTDQPSIASQIERNGVPLTFMRKRHPCGSLCPSQSKSCAGFPLFGPNDEAPQARLWPHASPLSLHRTEKNRSRYYFSPTAIEMNGGRLVVGDHKTFYHRACILLATMLSFQTCRSRPHGVAVSSPPFHGGCTGSNPVGVAISSYYLPIPWNLIGFHDLIFRTVFGQSSR